MAVVATDDADNDADADAGAEACGVGIRTATMGGPIGGEADRTETAGAEAKECGDRGTPLVPVPPAVGDASSWPRLWYCLETSPRGGVVADVKDAGGEEGCRGD